MPEMKEGVFDFTLTDQYVLDFMQAKNAEASVMNFDVRIKNGTISKNVLMLRCAMHLLRPLCSLSRTLTFA